MKKIKNLLAGISALAIMTTGAIPVSAETTVYAGIDTNAYRKYVSALDEFENEGIIFDMFYGNGNFETNSSSNLKNPPTSAELVNIYLNSSQNYDAPNGVRYIKEIFYVYPEYEPFPEYNMASFSDMIVCYDTYNLETVDFTSEELDEFLLENNLKAKVDTFEITDTEVNITLEFDEDMIISDAENMAYAVYKEYNIRPYNYSHTYADYFTDKEINKLDYINKEETSPTINFETFTIAGDLDNDSTPGLTDVVKLTKYNANSELYPLADTTALANADVNQDGTIDALDTNLLIEMVLGSYESAF